jgi:biotin carboxylase
MRRRVAVIGGSQRIFPSAPRPEFELVLFHNRNSFGYDERLEGLCDSFVDIDFLQDYARLERVFLEMHDEQPFERAYAQDEDALVISARLNRLLGVVDNSVLAAWRLKDKALMRRSISACTRNPVRFATVHSACELRSFMESVGGTVVVKPLDASGSVDVFTLERGADAAEIWRFAASRSHHAMLAEEFVDGPEFSVETYSWDGRHVVIGINRKLMLGALEIGHCIPCTIPKATSAELCRATTEFLTAVGLTHGPAHTELRIDDLGARVIESHNRTAGSRVPEMIELVYGIDIVQFSFNVAVGLEDPLDVPPAPNGSAAMRHILPDPGTVTEISGVNDIRDPDVRLTIGLRPGDIVEEERTSYDLIKVGSWVVAHGSSEEDAVRKCERALQQLKIVTR